MHQKIISNLEKLRQAVPILGAKLWNEIPGRMRDMSKMIIFLDATMITREIKSQNPKP